MISESRQTQLKVEEYFDLLQYALDCEDYSLAEVYVSRLSAFSHMFNQDQEDFYEWSERFLEAAGKEEFYEPSEADEWYSYDPDC